MMTVTICTVRDSACGRVLADYKPAYYWWDCLEMLRKAILTGILVIGVSLSFTPPLSLSCFCLYLLTLRGNFPTHVQHFFASQMFFNKGSLTQLVVAMITSLGELDLVHFHTANANRFGSNILMRLWRVVRIRFPQCRGVVRAVRRPHRQRLQTGVGNCVVAHSDANCLAEDRPHKGGYSWC